MLTRKEIQEAVRDPEWQDFRVSLIGTSMKRKLKELDRWLQEHPGERKAQVQVENYINALRRGGLL